MTKRIVILMLCVLMMISATGCSEKELTITGQPESTAVMEGEAGTFTVTVSGGKEPYAYEWYLYTEEDQNWMLIAGSEAAVAFSGYDTPTLTTGKEIKIDLDFYCKVTDAEGTSVDSAKATLTVNYPLTIEEHPRSVTVTDEGETTSATFEVVVTGGMAPYTYQWCISRNAAAENIIDESDINTGTQTECLTMAGLNTDDDGSFIWCVITDAQGTELVSDKALLSVTEEKVPELVIKTQPKDQTYPDNKDIVFTVKVTGGKQPYTYQWYHDGVRLSEQSDLIGTQTNKLTVKYHPLDWSGDEFHCVITDARGTCIESRKAVMTVNPEPLKIAKQPADITVSEGESATFTVTASGGTAPYSYDWYVKMPNTDRAYYIGDSGEDNAYAGYKTNTFTLTHETCSGVEVYCMVYDSAGQYIQTKTVVLTVTK